MELELIGKWLIAIAIVVIMVGGYVILSGKGLGAIAFVKSKLRFGFILFGFLK